MVRGKVLGKGENFRRHGEIGYKELHDEAEERIEKSDKLHELGLRVESDKRSLKLKLIKLMLRAFLKKIKRR